MAPRKINDLICHIFSKVDKKGEDDCWLWLGARSAEGYGRIRINRHYYWVHRWIYEKLRGPIPIGFQIDHLCHVTLCVNPNHLEAVTPRENVLRSTSTAAKNAKKTHCPRGHEYTEQNTRTSSARKRYCRACAKDYQANRRWRQKSEQKGTI